MNVTQDKVWPYEDIAICPNCGREIRGNLGCFYRVIYEGIIPQGQSPAGF